MPKAFPEECPCNCWNSCKTNCPEDPSGAPQASHPVPFTPAKHNHAATFRLANQSAWERGRKQENPQKWLGEGAKGLRTHSAKVSQESLAPCATLFLGLHRCKRLLLPWVKRPFAPSLNHFQGFSNFRPLSQALWFRRYVQGSYFKPQIAD